MRQLKITRLITDRNNSSLDRFLQDVSKEEMITADEEVELAQKIKKGDEEALSKLVRANLRFVVSVAKQYQNQGMSLPDLINEGNIGLIKAAQRFDETRGFKFISYAVWWIRQSILSAIAENSRIVRLPINQVDSIKKLNRETLRLEQKYERAPSVDEIASGLDLKPERVVDIIRNSYHHVSMDAPLIVDEDLNLIDVIVDDDAEETDSKMIHESLCNVINRSLNVLDEKEKDIIERFYGINKKKEYSLDEIAYIHNLTRERVRQIRDRALKELKKKVRTQELKSYL